MKFINYVDQAMDPDGRSRLPYLVEDEYLYGLCAMQAWLHQDFNRNRCWKPCGLPVPTRGASYPIDSSWSAAYWATQLDSWKTKYDKDKATGSILSSRLHAEVVDMNARPLYHLSQLELRANLKAITELSMDTEHYTGVHRRHLEKQTMEWVGTMDARWALWHAAQVLKLWREREGGGHKANIDNDQNNTTERAEPRVGLVALIAIYEAGLVVWAYTRSVQVRDTCTMGSSLHTASVDSEPFDLLGENTAGPLLYWIEHGGRELINGSMVCACRLGDVIGFYESILARGSRHLRCGSQMAARLSKLKQIH